MKGFYYDQSTGEFGVANNDFVFPLGTGYAGKSTSRNVPNDDHRRSLGPLPRGTYKMEIARHDRFAAPAIKLTQTEGQTHHRSGFWVHGDNAINDASSGCIILNKVVRHLIAAFMADGYVSLHVRP